jgi:hypothetical protein
MTDVLLRTETYTPEEGDEDSQFKTKRYPNGSQVIVNERGKFFIGRRAPYFVSIACGGGQASSEHSQDVGNRPVRSVPILRLVPTRSISLRYRLAVFSLIGAWSRLCSI